MVFATRHRIAYFHRRAAAVVIAWAGCTDPRSNATRASSATPQDNPSGTSAARSAEASSPSAAPPRVLSAGASASSAPERPACTDLTPGRKASAADAPRVEHAPPKRYAENARGFDVSTPAPWKTLRDAGLSFAFVQAAIGPRANASFAANWSMAKACGFPRGAYQLVSRSADPASVATTLATALAGDPGEIAPALDLERPEGCDDDCCGDSCTVWNARIAKWVDASEEKIGRKVLVYMVEPFYNQCLCGAAHWSDRTLWLAAYPLFDFPEKPRLGGFTNWSFYQHEGNYRGYGGVVDLDIFAGDASALQAWLGRGQ